MAALQAQFEIAAYDLGFALVRLFYQAEFNWIHAEDPQPPPVAVERQSEELCGLIRQLERAVPRPNRILLCDGLINQLRRAWSYYRDNWQNDLQREAVAASVDCAPEEKYALSHRLLLHSPIASEEWRLLRQRTMQLIEALPAPPRRLALLGSFVAKAFYESATDRLDDEPTGVDREIFLVTNLLHRIQVELQPLTRLRSTLKCIDLNLSDVAGHKLIQRFEVFHHEIRAALRTPPSSTSSSSSDARPVRLKPCHQKALDSYRHAQRGMPIKEGSGEGQYKEIWDWLGENYTYPGELPSFGSWSRYVRAALHRGFGVTRHPSSPPTRSIATLRHSATGRKDRN